MKDDFIKEVDGVGWVINPTFYLMLLYGADITASDDYDTNILEELCSVIDRRYINTTYLENGGETFTENDADTEIRINKKQIEAAYYVLEEIKYLCTSDKGSPREDTLFILLCNNRTSDKIGELYQRGFANNPEAKHRFYEGTRPICIAEKLAKEYGDCRMWNILCTHSESDFEGGRYCASYLRSGYYYRSWITEEEYKKEREMEYRSEREYQYDIDGRMSNEEIAEYYGYYGMDSDDFLDDL